MDTQPPPETLWYRQLTALGRFWPETLRGDVEALHQTRVASRRIREALPVVAAGGNRAKVRRLSRKVRRITRALGPVRALDVGTAILAGLEDTVADRRAGLVLLQEHLATNRRRLRKRMVERVRSIDVERLVRRLARLVTKKAQPPELRAEGEREAWRQVLAERTLRRASRLREAVELAGALYVPDRLHAARVAAKKLRYILEVAGQAGVPQTSELVAQLKSIQGTLGHLHDLQALLDQGRELQASIGTAPGHSELAAVLESLETECRRLHAEFLVRHKDLVEICDLARGVAAGELPVGRLKTARAALKHGRPDADTSADSAAAAGADPQPECPARTGGKRG